jgi:SAM-dependent methyltransferase
MPKFEVTRLCRFCGGVFYSTPLLRYPNSPGSAQGFAETRDAPSDNVDLNIYQCRSCGLVQHALTPVCYYRDVIRAVAFSPEMAEFRAAQLADWLKRTELTDKPVLEVGCGRGEYLELLKRAGAAHVSGLEASPTSVSQARAQGLDVAPGYLEAGLTLPWNQYFHGFAIFSFMEHWPDLRGSLAQLHTLLHPEARGLVEVPNFQLILDRGLYSEFTPDHIFYFDESTLRRVLEQTGFEVQAVQSVWHDYILSAEVAVRSPMNTAKFERVQQQIVQGIHEFAGRFAPHEVVVWGAGHQALAVLSMANLVGRVSHVVDSAPFKQGKYTPGTRLMIKSPETLAEDRPRAVLIMAAAYSNEVARQLVQKFPHIANVAVLREDVVEVVKHE